MATSGDDRLTERQFERISRDVLRAYLDRLSKI
jgi:hypothetical protein